MEVKPQARTKPAIMLTGTLTGECVEDLRNTGSRYVSAPYPARPSGRRVRGRGLYLEHEAAQGRAGDYSPHHKRQREGGYKHKPAVVIPEPSRDRNDQHMYQQQG